MNQDWVSIVRCRKNCRNRKIEVFDWVSMSLWSSCIPATFSCLTMHYNGRWQVAGGNLVEALFLQFSICKGRRWFFTCSHPGKAEAKNKKCNCCHFQLHLPLGHSRSQTCRSQPGRFHWFPLACLPQRPAQHHHWPGCTVWQRTSWFLQLGGYPKTSLSQKFTSLSSTHFHKHVFILWIYWCHFYQLVGKPTNIVWLFEDGGSFVRYNQSSLLNLI